MNDTQKKIRLNVGCGGRPLQNYINVDADDLEAMRRRYPAVDYPDDIVIHQYDIFNFPFEDGEVDEVRADSLIEHLGFVDEPRFFHEVRRILKPGGKFVFSTPNFEEIVKMWLNAKDDWKEFFRNDDEAIAQEHWFGNNSYSMDNRWGYLTATMFGSQNGAGQHHQNCYTVAKIEAIISHLGMEVVEIGHSLWKGDRDPMIDVIARVPPS